MKIPIQLVIKKQLFFKLKLLLLILILPSVHFAQNNTQTIPPEKKLDNLSTKKDSSILDSIYVPETDPRLYSIIYEERNKNSRWEPVWWLDTMRYEKPLFDDETHIREIKDNSKKKYHYKTKRSKFGFIKGRRDIRDSVELQNNYEKEARRWDSPKYEQTQLYDVVDIKSKLIIQFDKNAMARNENLSGNISLAAWINNKPIEVAPYSMIGKEREKIGLNSKPPKEISENLIRLMAETKELVRRTGFVNSIFDLYREYLSVRPDTVPTEIIKIVLERYENVLNEIPGKDTISLNDFYKDNPMVFENIWEYVFSYLPSEYLIGYDIFRGTPNSTVNGLYLFIVDINANWSSIKNKLTKRGNFYDYYNENKYKQYQEGEAFYIYNESKVAQVQAIDSLRFQEFNELKFAQFKRKLNLISKYLDFFSNPAHGETQDAFLTLIGMDKIYFKHLSEILKGDNEELQKIKDYKELIEKEPDSINYNKLLLLYNIQQTLIKISSFEGSELHKLLSKAGYSNDFFLKQIKSKDIERFDDFRDWSNNNNKANYSSTLYFDSLQNNGLEKAPYLFENFDVLSQLRTQLARKAGETIYQKLWYATIDLNYSRAEDGDELKIAILWYGPDKSVANVDTTQAVELVTAQFKLKDTGWKVKVSDSFLLINRINEELLRDNYPLNPYDFKPTGGFSLLWTYHNNKKKYRYNHYLKRHERIDPFMKFIKWMEPSIGINVSAMDFDTTKPYGIGAGPIVGLFRNKIFVTAGYNFHVDREQPWYWGIGFSFANVTAGGVELSEENKAKIQGN
ncbi:MAG: hypothetical protein AAFZ15_08590 [Bacteroidota bacterium]